MLHFVTIVGVLRTMHIEKMKYTTYSVLMSVYKKDNPVFLELAMRSIFEQTVKTDDFVLICDGELTEELDRVISIMQGKHKEVLHVHRLKENSGLGNALNSGITLCKNELVARMDSDDFSISNRCEKQLDMFNKDTDLSIASGMIIEFKENITDLCGKRKLPLENDKIIQFSKRRNPFNHPAVMYKKMEVVAAGGYSERFHLFEDYYLWIRMLQNGCKGANTDDSLVMMRISDDTFIRRGGKKYAEDLLRFHYWMLKTKWISKWDLFFSTLPHALICLLPNKLRKAIYMHMLR